MGHGIGSVVGKGEKSILNSEGFTNLLCLSIEKEDGFSQRIILHFNIRPLNTISKPPSNGFEESLLSCESDSKAFGRSGPLPTVNDFFLCEDPTEEKVSPTSYQALDRRVHECPRRSKTSSQRIEAGAPPLLQLQPSSPSVLCA